MMFTVTCIFSNVRISQQAIRWLAEMSGGDARIALSTLQVLVESHSFGLITVNHAKEALQVFHTTVLFLHDIFLVEQGKFFSIMCSKLTSTYNFSTNIPI